MSIFDIEPGVKKQEYVSIPDFSAALPVTVIRGYSQGLNVLITAGIHNEEYVGIETANRVREHLPQLPILVTSGMDQHRVLPQLRAGIHFLPKPYSMSELLDAIRLCFRHADVGVLTGPGAQAA